MTKAVRKPSYCLHRATGQARVRINGKDIYLGQFGTPESRERYDDLIREWSFKNGNVTGYALTVDELCLRFLEEADRTYRHADGTETGSTENFRQALRWLVSRYGRERVRDFGPLKLKAVRQAMADAELCRTNINRQVARIRQVVKWGVENELIPVEIHQALCAVSGLRRGRQGVRESEPVRAVSEADIEATMKHLPQVVADMVRLQLLTGARPGEICMMRPCDVSRDGEVWSYRPRRHKTEHHGKDRIIFIGPEGQTILLPYLLRDSEACCFSPRDSEAKRNEERRENRQSPMTPSQRTRQQKRKTKVLKDHYAKDAYNRAVSRACRKAGVSVWSPNRLRHARATLLRAKFGIEAAQVVLGHSSPQTTLIYAEADRQKAAEIARQIG